MVLSAIPALNGISEKIGVGLTMSRNWTDPPMQIMLALAVGLIVLIVGEYVLATQLGIWYMALPFLPVYAYYHTFMMATPAANTEEFLTSTCTEPPPLLIPFSFLFTFSASLNWSGEDS